MAASRPAVTLRLSAILRDKVLRSGYTTVADLCSVPLPDLVAELSLSVAQTEELKRQLYPSPEPLKSFTANENWEKEKSWASITTSSKALDSLFGGSQGIIPGKITEICGLPGMGKTQLGLQLCINAQLPPSAGGAGGTSIFIDTEGSLIASRVAQIGSASLQRLAEILNDYDKEAALTADVLLQGIQYCRVHSPVELVAMGRVLSEIVRAQPKVKMIVLDSISFPFRSNFSDINGRTKLVATLGRQLSTIARDFNVAVVVINQMTTKIDAGSSNGNTRSDQSVIQPALGETWANFCTHRIRLGMRQGDNKRTAHLFKSPNIMDQTVPFAIETDGIRDVKDYASLNPYSSSTP
ncbi:RAD51-like protein 2 [Entomortierella parvispora]|uniref:DNA repair protein RAD51 homolog 3 n=1 Tax=Entomortierella parvispora TaxID=205924 RepID=A0A9P3HMG7_9FUNG|nr:RAD51-like protein 2 [Entomortierella parvispora]